ncbi:MAG: hypothetical protein A2745_03695 [Candidatus Harrisonbacteria bacterium RIFCSPHIGHO2_01_FULL_44_13]|uniref:Uncharacterized protein n=1 Tax=Candidatus Harrisonbacteria bacterium RIFCSPLOWO2_01_FULL_44_18 TaxID=1798407 RepID=A0A1G1ZNW1_9BACT|nr:MAG: hypothetical protein A2745_03695 [Candidatus Harrisonbacteria bacterium RIFCSPHIGHO2_01_FULL_44_13]OGY66284.1 MAG: hypothetical protein A3A16_00015 [Candidatus Harrisonbacteria bacterium RIFCSPLOWO2_01_FULL_44_18]
MFIERIKKESSEPVKIPEAENKIQPVKEAAPSREVKKETEQERKERMEREEYRKKVEQEMGKGRIIDESR